MKILGGLLVAAALTVMVVPDADARGRRGGSFSGARSYSSPYKTTAPRPAIRQDWQKTPVRQAPVYQANRGATGFGSGVRGQNGGQFNNAFASNYQRTGFNPSARQSSFFSNPWFWMAMMGGYSMLNNSSHAEATPAQSQAEFEANCRAAAISPEKPADVTVAPEECAELARLAFAKVQAEAVSPTQVVASDTVPQAEPVAPIESSNWMLYILGALVLVPLGLGFMNRRRK